MATTLNLNPNNSSQVGSAQKFKILTGEPNTWMFIYSGIAGINQQESSDSFLGIDFNTASSNATVNIKLDNISGMLLGFAATASLTNIDEMGNDAQWYIMSDTLTLQDNGDLIFTATTYTWSEGGDTDFYGMGYYVSAKILVETATISGTIRWRKTLATPLGSPHFVITASVEVPSAGPSLFPTTQVVATGTEGGVNAADDTYYYVPYTITEGLFGKTVTVSVVPIDASFSGAPLGGSLLANQISGPSPISLTNSNLNVTNVDFEMGFVGEPQ
jgi:hypothetical protein